MHVLTPLLRIHLNQKEFVLRELHFGAYGKRRKTKLQDGLEGQKEAAKTE